MRSSWVLYCRNVRGGEGFSKGTARKDSGEDFSALVSKRLCSSSSTDQPMRCKRCHALKPAIVISNSAARINANEGGDESSEQIFRTGRSLFFRNVMSVTKNVKNELDLSRTWLL